MTTVENGDTVAMRSDKEKTTNLYKKIIDALEQVLFQINSNDLTKLDEQLIEGIITMLNDFLQSDLIMFKKCDQNNTSYARITELLYQFITWLFIRM